ncbi:ABC transporter substrate-binding protein [Xanthobacter pseudotagetidis]|uniref:ABC transporter substrate-binding protein n=1 Tax=Xanthobacter pseudotagetidis TaxID=3119911 RepID=UPI00372B28DA
MSLTRRNFLAAGAALPLITQIGLGSTIAKAAPAMRIATGVDPGFAPFYLLSQTDIMKKRGVELELTTGPSGGATVPFVIGGQANAAMASSLPGIRTHLVSPKVVCVAQMISYDRFFGIVSVKEVGSLKDLAGKKIGVETGSASELMWRRALEHHKLDAKDFTSGIVPIEPPEMIAALERGQIDAFSCWEPWLTRAVQKLPNAKILLTNEDIFQDVGYVYMNRDWIEANKKESLAFMGGLHDAYLMIRNDPDKVLKVIVDYLKLPEPLVKELLTKVTFSYKLDQQSYNQSKAVVDAMLADGRLKKPFDYKAWFYPELMAQVDPKAVSLPANM